MEIGSLSWKRAIRSGAKEFSISVPEEALEDLAVHARELIRWNRAFNLTAIVDPLQLAIKHYLDAIVPATVIPRHSRLLDIGSGGGFPGIPLKILQPTLDVTLIDSVRKKVNFLKHVIRSLELEDIVAYHIRAENFHRNTSANLSGHDNGGKREPKAVADQAVRRVDDPFDVIISRALTTLNGFFTIALPLLANDGMLIAMKGRLTEAELNLARKALPEQLVAQGFPKSDGKLKVVHYQLPPLEAERTMVIVQVSG